MVMSYREGELGRVRELVGEQAGTQTPGGRR